MHIARSKTVMWIAIAVVAVPLLVVTVVAARSSHRAPSTATTTTTTTSTSTAITTTTSAPTTTTPSTNTTTTTLVPSQPVVVRRLATSAPVVALTFDAGSDAGYLSSILDTLAGDGIHASFGITGVLATAHPDLVARIAREGHLVVNHTYDHRSFTGYSTGTAPLSAGERRHELAAADDAIRAATGVSPTPWFRPPYGDRDEGSDEDAAAAGHPFVAMWSVDTLGWNGSSVDEIVERCADGAAPGTIYLLHVGSQSLDGPALPRVIATLRAAGYGFVTLAGAP